MKRRQQTVVAEDWDGEFGSYHEWAKLGPQPPYRKWAAITAPIVHRNCNLTLPNLRDQ